MPNRSGAARRIWEGILTGQQIASHALVGPNQQFVLTRREIEVGTEGGEVVLSWPTAGNESYSLQSTADLLHPAWVTVTNGISASNGSYRLALAPNAAAAWYRLKR